MPDTATPSLANSFFQGAMSPAFREDPYPYYERFRGPAPLLRVADTIWFAMGHAHVTALLRHPRLSTDESRSTAEKAKSAPAARSRSLLFMDPPDHTRLRNLVARAFTPRRIEELRGATETIAKELVHGLKVRGPDADLIEAFAYPLPVRVICALLGVPAVDEAMFTEWSRAVARSLDPSILRSPELDAKIDKARQDLRAYLADLLAARRKVPGNDLLSALAAVDVDGDRITSAEVLALAVLLLVAGHETTVNLIGNGMLALLRAPEQLEKLCQSPELVGPAVDELLRFAGPRMAEATDGLLPVIHSVVVAPNGEVWVGDRASTKIVVFDKDLKQRVREIQVGNLTCGFYVDATGQLWMSTGRHGMVLKMGWDGKVQGWFGKHGDVRDSHDVGEGHYMAVSRDQKIIFMADSVLAKVHRIEHN